MAILAWPLGSFAKLNPSEIFQTIDSQNKIQKISQIF